MNTPRMQAVTRTGAAVKSESRAAPGVARNRRRRRVQA